MKQNFTYKGLATLYFIMRVSLVNLVFLAITSLQVITAKSVHGQTAEDTFVNIDEQHISLKEIFKKIEGQTNFLFVYAPEVIDKYQDVSITGGRQTVADILSELFVGKSIVYSESGLNIILRRRGDTILEIAESGKSSTNSYQELVKINGRVADVNGDPLPGVNVVVKGTTIGTSTGKDGDYSIELPEGSNVLVFSFIGYKPITIEVGNRATIDIVLEEDVAQLKEVVVNGGYYETTDKMKTGSIVKVSAKDIEKQPVTSPLLALQGRVPGLEITPSSGAPGVAPLIRIRGTNSLRNGSPGDAQGNGNYPLYVIDGVPIISEPARSWTTSFTSAGYDPLSTINPANIESIEILKDGDATSIYGSRGANGVILITTKKSSKNSDQTSFELTPYIGVGQVSKRLNLMNTQEYLAMRREGIAKDGLEPGMYDYDLIYWDQDEYTDWQKLLIGGTANITDIQSTISSSTKNTSFRLNGGYHKETLVFPGDFGYSRYTGQLTVNHTSSNERFSMTFSSTFGADNNKLFADGGAMMANAISLPPNAPDPFLQDGSLNWEIHDVGGYPTATWSNPFRYLLTTQRVENINIINNGTFTYEFWKSLTLSVSMGYSNFKNNENAQTPLKAVSPNEVDPTGTSNFVSTRRTSWIVEPKISYTKKVGSHKLDVVAGITAQSNNNASDIIAGSYYASDALLGSLIGAGKVDVVQNDNSEYRYNSLYARVAYNWKGKYLLNITGRRDGSSRFGPENKFGNFGSVGAAWIFATENRIQSTLPFISFGKIRASYGITGSDQIGDYSYLNLYQVLTAKYGNATGLAPNALYNSDFAWETTSKLESALEMYFADNRFGFEVNWYRNRSSNQLVSTPLPIMTGFASVLSNLDAIVENSGWEVTLRGDVLNDNAWSWNISMNFSRPRNRLIRFDGIEDSPYVNRYRVGEPLSLQWLYTWKGVNPQTGLYEIEDKNDDGIFNDLDRSLFNLTGNKYYGGVSNSIRYKSISIAFLFQFTHQRGERYMPGMPGKRGANQLKDALDERWQNVGDNSNVQRFSLDEGFQPFSRAQFSNYNSTDASFIRLKTVSINYELPENLLSAIKVTASRVFVQGQNIFTITKYEGPDPETGVGLPPLRVITLGVQLKF